ncbi:DUF302 domain-containing protein [Oceaniglobus roseus]|uniref:DUF302 domain-containing protein n=1 Tax=Oceaniglobus roseus TaxID=1737570 RepID=UPI001562759A|nr:DUF302 domain-containing protein [Kandeliimicrobium roseum]
MTLKTLTAAALSLALAGPALADINQRMANGSVADAMARLKDAVEEAGATVFATVDHGKGATDAGMELGESQLLIFGNPKLGTPVMQMDPQAGLFLPLKILVYADPDGQTWVAYEDVNDTFDGLGVSQDAGAIDTMENVLEKFSTAVAGGT